MKIKISPAPWIDNTSDIAILSCSVKAYEPLLKAFKDLGFELTDESPEIAPVYPPLECKDK